MKILLINSSPFRRAEHFSVSEDVEAYFRVLERRGVKLGDQRHEANNGLLSIAGTLRSNGKEVRYLDLNVEENRKFIHSRMFFSDREIFDLIDRNIEGIDVVLISSLTISFPIMKKVGEYIKFKHPGMPIIMGGIYATLNPDEFVKLHDCYDVVVLGEGEDVIVELVDILTGVSQTDLSTIKGIVWRDKRTGKNILNPGQNFVKDLNTLPFPAYDLMEGEDVVYRVFTARGCPYECTFCAPAYMSGYKLRRIRPGRVMEQLKLLKTEYKVTEFVVGDLTFLGDSAHSKEILRLMIDQRVNVPFWCQSRFDCLDTEGIELLRTAGCCQIALGVESFNQSILEAVRKGIYVNEITEKLMMLKQSGIEVQCYFIIGLPGETKDTVQNTVEFMSYALVEGLIHKPHIGVYVPFPGLPVPDEVTIVGEGYDSYTSGVFLDLPPRPAARTESLSEQEAFELWKHALVAAGKELSKHSETVVRVLRD